MLTGGFDDWLMHALFLLGFTNYFLLFRELLTARSATPAGPASTSWSETLPTLIGALPLLGLLGTIIGLLQVFHALSLGPATDLLTDGIALALLSTQCGLSLAIPAWLLLAWLRASQARIGVA